MTNTQKTMGKAMSTDPMQTRANPC
jgi:hypothetical protein